MNPMMTTTTPIPSHRAFSLPGLLLALAALLSVGCGDWAEFGNGPLNMHASRSHGPEAGIAVQHDLLNPGAGHGPEVGVLVDKAGDYYVSSYDPEIHVYDHAGAWMGSYDLGVDGPRAAPYVASRWGSATKQSTLFTGAEGGGFYAIQVDKTTLPYTLTLMDADKTFGTSESSPKRARDKTLYIASQWGDVVRYEYTATGALNRIGTFSLGEVIPGAIALYDVDPQHPGEEVLVATADGNFYVLDHRLTMIIWMNSAGAPTKDLYYAGVTVAPVRCSSDAYALLPIADAGGVAGSSPNSGKLRAINLFTQAVDWELSPSHSVIGRDAIEGSVAILHAEGSLACKTDRPSTEGGGDSGAGGGILENQNGGSGGGIVVEIPGGGGIGPAHVSSYHATFASTDGHLYGVDVLSGHEIWNYGMTTGGYDAPVVDGNNIIYVGDGRSNLHAVEGKTSCAGCPIWMDNSINVGGASDIVKLGLTNTRGLVVGSGVSAYALFE